MPDLTERHDAIQRARALFASDHLPDHLAQLVDSYASFADMLIAHLPDDAMLRESLIKLWESKNCAVYVAARIDRLPEVPLPPAGFGATTPHARET